MRRLIGRWLCSRGRHKLKEIRGQQNVGYCTRCGQVYAMGRPMRYEVPRA